MLKISKSPTRELVGGKSNRFVSAMNRFKKLIAIVLLIGSVGICAAAVYVWYIGQSSSIVQQQTTVKAIAKKEKEFRASSSGRVGVAVQYVTDSVARGEMASMTAHTNANATCEIKVTYGSSEVAVDSALVPKKADDRGFVEWTWAVDPGVAPGKAQAAVTCKNEKNSGLVIGDIVIR